MYIYIYVYIYIYIYILLMMWLPKVNIRKLVSQWEGQSLTESVILAGKLWLIVVLSKQNEEDCFVHRRHHLPATCLNILLAERGYWRRRCESSSCQATWWPPQRTCQRSTSSAGWPLAGQLGWVSGVSSVLQSIR